MTSVIKLSCSVQTYAWGKIGLDSEVARLKQRDPKFVLQTDSPYAELWMGIHSKGPSFISHPPSLSGQSLQSWLESNPSALGSKVAQAFNNKLPFLFKVLSINKSLSIQAHPTKEHAAQLHIADPQHYPDANHKPEMAIALKDFQGLCGFRPISEITNYISNIPELQRLIGVDAVKQLLSLPKDDASEAQIKSALKQCFSALVTHEEENMKIELQKLVEKVKSGEFINIPSQDMELLLRLYNWFPDDVGCFCVFFLNFLRLKPGQALYLAPNEPHAYIFGECLECMACGDNVVRAGLTPKYRDKETLCSMLTYSTKPAADNIFYPKPHPTNKNISVYNPPTPEFAVAHIQCPSTDGDGELTVPVVQGPSIIILMDGVCKIRVTVENKLIDEQECRKGEVLFLPASCQVIILYHHGVVYPTLYQAYCEI